MLKSWNEMRAVDISKYVKTRDKARYLPWASCLKLLYEHGAEKVSFTPLTTENGSSLFMSDQIFADSTKKSNRCYEVRVEVVIDGNAFGISYPVLNGITAVNDGQMNQNVVHKAQMRAFVKAVAINTGLGFDLWIEDTDIEDEWNDLSKHNIFAIRERMQIAYTNLMKKGMTTREVAQAMGTSEQTVQYYLGGIFDEIYRFEKGLNEIHDH